MGKLYRNLYHQIWNPINVWWAYKQAARGKRLQLAVAAFEYDLEAQLLSLEGELQSQTYMPGGYHNFIIDVPKRRLISAAPFRDRVAHHVLMNVIEPFFERQFIYDSYANRKGKGTHRALDRCTYYLRRHRYVMHCDVRRFFPSVDHRVLRAVLARTIGDQAVLMLIDKILASGVGVQAEEYDMIYFPGDNLFAVNRPRGLPIGNLTSQHWANVYLNELDQYAKRELKCQAYIRYVDDVLLFADEKQTLKFPKSERFRLARRLEDSAFTFYELLVQATRGKQKRRVLLQADLELEKLRLYVRMAQARKLTSQRQYRHAAGELVEIGKLLGGWLKTVPER